MIRKLRLKFVAICMALVTVVLAAVFFSVYFSMARNISGLSRQVLQRVAQEAVIGSGVNRPDISITIGGDRVLLPYFTVNLWPSRNGGCTARQPGGSGRPDGDPAGLPVPGAGGGYRQPLPPPVSAAR